MRKLFRTYIYFIVLTIPYYAGAQTTQQLHLITKTMEKSFTYQDGYEVNIEGEKADVFIDTWDKKEISIKLELSARHPDKAIAEADLEKIKYIAKRVKNKIYLRNYISEGEGIEAPTSNLDAQYTIYVPEECPVYLKNYFGVSNVSNLTNQFRFFGEFSQVGMKNMSGNLDLTSRFGDINGKVLNGIVSVDSRRSDITLEQIQGSYNIKAEYGVVRILSGQGLLDLNIDADKSDVYLFDKKLLDYGYVLNTQHGEVRFPSDLKLEFIENSDEVKKLQFTPQQEFYPSVSISVTFGDVYLEKSVPVNADF